MLVSLLSCLLILAGLGAEDPAGAHATPASRFLVARRTPEFFDPAPDFFDPAPDFFDPTPDFVDPSSIAALLFSISFSVPFLIDLGSILPPNLAPKIHHNR